jgi:alpha-ketoglutarate-dependent taurine dioxygenase
MKFCREGTVHDLEDGLERPVVAPIHRVELDPDSAKGWRYLADELADELAAELLDSEPVRLSPGALSRLSLLAQELPRTIRGPVTDFRLSVPGTPDGAMVISGLPLTRDAIAATPHAFQMGRRTDETRAADMALLLLASLFGDPFSHAAVQAGSLILDICPFAGDEETQLASSSSGGLHWHNEDAYHEFRADWLLLMCLRNPESTPTTVARVKDVSPAAREADALWKATYELAPDTSHLSPQQMPRPQAIPVLSGDPEDPFIRIDPEFMGEGPVTEGPLKTLVDELNANLRDVTLGEGDILVVDNRRAVHGRRSFDARYDGTDRWLRVVNVTADLRRSAGERDGRALRTQGIAG